MGRQKGGPRALTRSGASGSGTGQIPAWCSGGSPWTERWRLQSLRCVPGSGGGRGAGSTGDLMPPEGPRPVRRPCPAPRPARAKGSRQSSSEHTTRSQGSPEAFTEHLLGQHLMKCCEGAQRAHGPAPAHRGLTLLLGRQEIGKGRGAASDQALPAGRQVVLAAQGQSSPFCPRHVRLRLRLSRLPHLRCPLPLSQPRLSVLQLTLVPATPLWQEGKVWGSSWLNYVGREESRTAPGGAKLPAWKVSEDSASPTWPPAPPRLCHVLAPPCRLPCLPPGIPGSSEATGNSLMRSPRWKLRRLWSSVM